MKNIVFENSITVCSSAPQSKFPAELFSREINSRIPGFCSAGDAENASFVFELNEALGRDDYSVELKGGKVFLLASGVRGFIYSVGRILRKIYPLDGGFCLMSEAFGAFSPEKEIRGHQLGYRTTANSYEAWSLDDYDRYYLDLMYFGMNTAEHIPYESGKSHRNRLMKYDEEEFLIETVRRMDEIDLDVSLWHPNNSSETDESARETRARIYSKLKRIDHLFIPGGDPGDLPAKDFVKRCEAISGALKESHPGAKLWPSAQAPHGMPGWGDEFLEALKGAKGVYGVIYGPNHAMPLEELRSRLPGEYPIRFYPDITHNVRCEYPVHFDKNDWHYALCACLSRECVNPRPAEYARLHEVTKDYVVGSVSYSEGINDDVNKAVWSLLDYDSKTSVREAVEDYCRLFFFGKDSGKAASLILSLEQNWVGGPAENEGIEETYRGFAELSEKYPELNENKRFLLLEMRAACDKFVRDRLIFEQGLIGKAEKFFLAGDNKEGVKALKEPLPDEILNLREDIEKYAALLFEKAGLQTDVERYCADNWERGAVLETIDLPVTDRQFIINKIDELGEEYALKLIGRDRAPKGEFHYSVAANGVSLPQKGEPYFNFQGDRPNVNNGKLPTAFFNVFDNFTFSVCAEGLEDNVKYLLRAVHLDRRDENEEELVIKAFGNEIYRGDRFGKPDGEYDRVFGCPGFVSALYEIPQGAVREGKLELEFSERIMGVMIAEIAVIKA